jgi:hypothetical protein
MGVQIPLPTQSDLHKRGRGKGSLPLSCARGHRVVTVRSPSAVEDRAETGRGVAMRGGGGVRVDAQRRGDVRVSEPLGDHVGPLASLQGEQGG